MPAVKVYPSAVGGRLAAPPSKSAAHRALICAALSGAAGCRVAPLSGSADMEATLGVLDAMGFRGHVDEGCAVFEGCAKPGAATANCKESGSTLRFLLPVAAALGCPLTFQGEGRLPQRPLSPLLELLEAHGVTFSAPKLPFTIGGRLKGGLYELPGDISSQYITGLLFALPLVQGDSEIRLTSPLQSAGYVDMTLASLKQAGIRVECLEGGWHIPGGQAYRGGSYTVEGDWSNAAFWLCAGAVASTGGITVSGLDTGSRQGDRAVVDCLRRFGARVEEASDRITAAKAPLHGCRIDAAPIPDLIPVLAVTAAYAEGETEIYNAARLRLKESDRIATVAALLRSIGARVEETPDSLVIHGSLPLRGGMVDGANDHRIVMAASVAALGCAGPVTVSGMEAANKSYPEFFADLKKIGGCFDVV